MKKAIFYNNKNIDIKTIKAKMYRLISCHNTSAKLKIVRIKKTKLIKMLKKVKRKRHFFTK